MKIVFMGTPEFAVPSLKMLYEHHEVLLVVTQPDRLVGRKKELKKSPVKIYANQVNLPLAQPEKLSTIDQQIIDLNPDYIVTAAYGQMVSKKLLNHVKAINVHGSLLPKYRGGAPIQYALFDGQKETGITVMYMAEKMDSGDIIRQMKVKIDEADNYKTLMLRMSFVGSTLLKEVLEDFEKGKVESVPQNLNEVTYAYTIKRHDEWLDFNQSSTSIINRIRGLSPEPGASMVCGKTQIKVYHALDSGIINEKALCGTILDVEKKFTIKTKDGSIDILELQVSGKKKMDVKSFLNGQTVLAVGNMCHIGE